MRIKSFWGIVVWLLVYAVFDMAILFMDTDSNWYYPIWILPVVVFAPDDNPNTTKWEKAKMFGKLFGMALAEAFVIGYATTYIVRAI